MATRQYIAPFPANINRDHFGSWLSGFTDGEGYFQLGYGNQRGYHSERAVFQILLRDDDANALRLIQSYWQCGIVTCGIPTTHSPQANYRVLKLSGLLVACDHFERYPLFAKKRRDFALWSQAIRIMARVHERPRLKKSKSHRSGFLSRWKPEEREAFRELCEELRAIRRYSECIAVPRHIEIAAPGPVRYPLFDQT